MTNKEYISWIDAYLNKTLSDQEMRKLENLLESDSDLKKIFDEHKVFKSQLHDAFFKEELEQIHQSLSERPKSQKRWYIYFAAAASVALLIGIFFGYQLLNKDTFYEKHFIPDPGLPTIMGAETSSFQFNDGMIDYKLENYDSALLKWKPLLAEATTNDTLQYYIAMAELNRGRLTEAKEMLQTFSESSTFSDDAFWYLALIYVEEKDFGKAKKLLSKLPKTERVSAILNSIE